MKKHKYTNADGEIVCTVITTDNPDMLKQAAEKVKVKFPHDYSFLRYAGSADYFDNTRGQW